jgi:hypothetical protein
MEMKNKQRNKTSAIAEGSFGGILLLAYFSIKHCIDKYTCMLYFVAQFKLKILTINIGIIVQCRGMKVVQPKGFYYYF